MISNNELLKLFVRVPSSVANFNGAEVSGANGEIRLFFEEATGLIWAKGQRYGITAAQAQALTTLIGSDTNKSVRDIVGEIIGVGDDANTKIDRLKEVLDWFNNVDESTGGAATLISQVGSPKVLYTASEALAANAELTGALNSTDALTAEQAITYNTVVTGASKQEGDILSAEEAAAYNATLTGAVAAGDIKIAATGLYKYVDDHVQAATPQGFSELINDVDALETTVGDLEDRIEALEEFDPWEDYVAPTPSGNGGTTGGGTNTGGNNGGDDEEGEPDEN